jgi:hypothetical protein
MDTLAAFRRLLQAAVAFEKKAPKQQRIEGERETLREAIYQAQLLLSVLERQGKPGKLHVISGGKGKSKIARRKRPGDESA